MSRRGFVLIIVLWVLLVAGSLGLSLSAVGQDGLRAADNRQLLTGIAWQAHGCVASSVAMLDDSLHRTPAGPERERLWANLDELVEHVRDVARLDCDLSIVSSEARLDVNAASPAALRAYLGAVLDPAAAEVAVAAFLDWTDADDEMRHDGAEYAWYSARDRIGPRNDRVGAVEELGAIRGLESLASTRRDLVTEGGFLIDVLHASPAVLAAVPGFSPALVAEIVRRRSDGWMPADHQELLDLVPAALAPDLAGSFASVASIVLLRPRTWLVQSSMHASRRSVVRHERWQVGRGESHLAVVARRSW